MCSTCKSGVTRSGGAFAYCWGNNIWGQAGNGFTGEDEFVPTAVRTDVDRFLSVSAGRSHTCALTPSGVVYCWGQGTSGQLGDGEQREEEPEPQRVSAGGAFGHLATGGDHSCGLSVGGLPFCWGAGDNGQLGTGREADESVPAAVSWPPR